jgi:hypothetical protein
MPETFPTFPLSPIARYSRPLAPIRVSDYPVALLERNGWRRLSADLPSADGAESLVAKPFGLGSSQGRRVRALRLRPTQK